MKKISLLLFLAALVSPQVFAGDVDKSTAAAVSAIDKPGEKVASEDALLRNFHTVDLGLEGIKLYRSASPVRELVKGKDVAADNPEVVAQSGKIMEHIKKLGILTIVSLEDPADTEKNGGKSISVEVEKNAAKSAGITFLSHPMRNADFKDMKPEDILAWLQGVEKDINGAAKNGGVLFHCAAGHDRTGLVAAYLRITVNKWQVDRAIAEMRSMGHNWVKYSSNDGQSSWHEEFLKQKFSPIPQKEVLPAAK